MVAFAPKDLTTYRYVVCSVCSACGSARALLQCLRPSPSPVRAPLAVSEPFPSLMPPVPCASSSAPHTSTPPHPLSLPSPRLLLRQVQDEGRDLPGGRARRPRDRRPPARGREAPRGAATALHPGALPRRALSLPSRGFLTSYALILVGYLLCSHFLTSSLPHVSLPSRLSLTSLSLFSRWWGRRRRAPWSSTRTRPWPRCGWSTPRKPRYPNTSPSRDEGHSSL